MWSGRMGEAGRAEGGSSEAGGMGEAAGRAEGEGGRLKGERRKAKGSTTARKRAHPYTIQIYGNSRVTAPKGRLMLL